MFRGLNAKYDWVLNTLICDSKESLDQGLEKAVIIPALEKHAELMMNKTAQLKTRDIRDY